ncbi:mechanosensitive ion channel family protein [Legionella hackeliae]|uniref:Mechanosensitive ion channel MscS domain-containing protein n=1 Tax=Legionella hackeliae TaxID=449 RepID=A0A0A8UR76_LEGHA|nr:mechanosensitive ion channel domain-containing protein [Legionella hackeliae]KTD15258.1 potassium efflux system KefA [Legionella hackeliae]CEK11375.1 membrane protein of unknown function [Legionella hackeliae]STX48147.1 potassium efflux system KefA [Legionella hackeliae]
MQKILFTAIFLVLSFFAKGIWASTTLQIYNGFDIHNATIELENIEQELSKKNLNYEQLYSTVKLINDLQDQASNCVDDGKEQLKKLNELLNNNEIASTLSHQNDARYHELIADKQLHVKAIADCVFFNYQAQEILNKINAMMGNTPMFNLLNRSPPVWEDFNPKLFFRIAFSRDKFTHMSGFNKLSSAQKATTVMILFICFFMALIVQKIISTFKGSFHNKLVNNLLTSLTKSGLFFLLVLIGPIIYLYSLLGNETPKPTLLLASNAILYYAFTLILIRFFVILFRQYANDSDKRLLSDIYLRGIVFVTFLLWGRLATIALQDQWIPPALLRFRFVVFCTLLILSFGWFSWLIFRLPFFKEKMSPSSLRNIKFSLAGIYFFTIVTAWIGYSNFAIYFIPNVVTTLVILFIVWKVSYYFGYLFALLNNPGQPASEKIHRWLGIKSTQTLTELLVIRIILNTGFIVFSLFLLMKVWGISQYHMDYLKTWYFQGGYVYGIYLWPVRFVRAAIAFCLLLMVGRALSTFVARHSAFKREKYRQDNIATLINYSAFSIAAIIALLIAGINFTSLAVIAGALSIGIGFGLQYLASDFVSGIILLIHKPVAPGDRVIIDGTEGYIKKIRLLSTQITTLTNADVIIPNSHLINKSVTNYTYRENKICRVNSQVILDSNGDLGLAEKVLLGVVKDHPSVVQEMPYTPTVSYELVPSKDNLHVTMELWYYIKNIDLKQDVSSEVNFNIVKALKEHNLCPGHYTE